MSHWPSITPESGLDTSHGLVAEFSATQYGHGRPSAAAAARSDERIILRNSQPPWHLTTIVCVSSKRKPSRLNVRNKYTEACRKYSPTMGWPQFILSPS